MTAYIALLRAINVSGHNPVKMADLQVLFRSLPAGGVTTYLQSGNVMFDHPDTPDQAAHLQDLIESRIADTLGFTVTVLLRSAEDFQQVVAENPFLSGGRRRSTEPSKLHVTFLTELPDPANLRRINASGGAPDEFIVRSREVFLYCPGGYGRTKLNNAFFEHKLGVAATTRNWKTVTTLAQRAQLPTS